jgi:hypothetical protein
MITAVSAAVARHRRATLACGTAAAAAVWAALVASDEAGGFLTGLFLAAGGCLLAAVVLGITDRRRAGRAFEIPPGGDAFRTPRGGATVLAGLAHVALVAAFAGPGAWLLRAGALDPAWLLTVVLLAAPLPAYAAGLWRGVGVTLTAGGLRVDRLAGTLIVPWAALDPAGAADPLPGGREVALRYARPGLVRTRGVVPVRDRFAVEGTTTGFAAAAIRWYAADPGRPGAIGTAAEHDRLRRRVTDRAPVEGAAPAPTAHALALRAAGGVFVFAAGMTAGMLLGPEHAVLGQATLLPAVLGLRGAVAAAARWRTLRDSGGCPPDGHEPPGRPAGRLVSR